jgi:hypothetical protein
MATLYVSEYSQLPISDNRVPGKWAMTPSIADQTVAIGASSVASSAFNVKTIFVRLAVDSATPCSVAFSASGATPVATTSNARLAANSVEYFGVQGGGKIAVIQNA